MPKTKQKKKKMDLKIEKVPYTKNTEVSCSCGAKFEVGSTLDKINIEVCSRCHPFYTGTQKLVDSSGRVDKFKMRLEKQNKINRGKKKSNSENNNKNISNNVSSTTAEPNSVKKAQKENVESKKGEK